jgi:hypothetical protein
MFKQSKRYSRKKLVQSLGCLFILLVGFLCPHQTFPDSSPTIDYSPWAAFAPNIKVCSLGQFTLPDPVKITLLKLRLDSVSTMGPDVKADLLRSIQQASVTYEIYGWRNNLCHVVIKADQPGNSSNTFLGFLGFDCNFTLEDLAAISTTADRLAAGKLLLTGEDPNANIKGRACKALVNSLPASPNSQVSPEVYFIK